MSRHIYICLILVIVALCQVRPAVASDLDDALAVYNTAAAGLQAKWDDFQDKQDAAFADVKDMYENLDNYYVLLLSDEEAANACWQAHLDAFDRLDNSTAPPVMPSLDDLITALEDAIDAAQAVQAADMEDRDHVAYATGLVHFQLPEQNFIFWKDPAYPQYDHWLAYTFPVLAKGDPLSHLSYQFPNSAEEAWFMQEIKHWVHLALFLFRHRDDGAKINSNGADLFDQLCEECAAQLTTVIYFNDCEITEEEIAHWCEDVGTGENGLQACDDPNLSDMEKNRDAMMASQCVQGDEVHEVQEIAEDGLHSVYSAQIDWPVYN